ELSVSKRKARLEGPCRNDPAAAQKLPGKAAQRQPERKTGSGQKRRPAKRTPQPPGEFSLPHRFGGRGVDRPIELFVDGMLYQSREIVDMDPRPPLAA